MLSMNIDDPGQLLFVSLGITGSVIAVAILVLVACRRKVQGFLKNTSNSSKCKITTCHKQSLHRYDPENEISELEELLSTGALDDEWLDDLPAKATGRSHSLFRGQGLSTLADITNHNRPSSRASINKMPHDKSDRDSMSSSSISNTNRAKDVIAVHTGVCVRTSHTLEEKEVRPSYLSDADEIVSIFSERLSYTRHSPSIVPSSVKSQFGKQLCNDCMDEDGTALLDLANVDAEVPQLLMYPSCTDYSYTADSDSQNTQKRAQAMFDFQVIQKGYGGSSNSTSPLSSSYDDGSSCHIPQYHHFAITSSVPTDNVYTDSIDTSSNEIHMQASSRNLSTSPSLSTVASLSTTNTDTLTYIANLSPSEVSTRLSSVLSSSGWSSATNKLQNGTYINDTNYFSTDLTSDSEYIDALDLPSSRNITCSGSGYGYGETWTETDPSPAILKDRLSITTGNYSYSEDKFNNSQTIQICTRADPNQAVTDMKVPPICTTFYQSHSPRQTLNSRKAIETREDLTRKMHSLVPELGTTGSGMNPNNDSCTYSEVKRLIQYDQVISNSVGTDHKDNIINVITSAGVHPTLCISEHVNKDLTQLDMGNSNDTDESFASARCHMNEDRSKFSNWLAESGLKNDNKYAPGERGVKTSCIQTNGDIAIGHSGDNGIIGTEKTRNNGYSLESNFQNNVTLNTMAGLQSLPTHALLNTTGAGYVSSAPYTHISENEHPHLKRTIQKVPHKSLQVKEEHVMLDLADQTETISKTSIEKPQPEPRPPTDYVNAHRLEIVGNISSLASASSSAVAKTQKTQCTMHIGSNITGMSTKVNPLPGDLIKTTDRHLHNTVTTVDKIAQLNEQKTVSESDDDSQSDISNGSGMNESHLLSQTEKVLHSLPLTTLKDRIEIPLISNNRDDNTEVTESCKTTIGRKSIDNSPYCQEQHSGILSRGTKSESSEVYGTSGLDTDSECSTLGKKYITNTTLPKTPHSHDRDIDIPNGGHAPDQQQTMTRSTHDASTHDTSLIQTEKHNHMRTSADYYPLQAGAVSSKTIITTCIDKETTARKAAYVSLPNNVLKVNTKSSEMIYSLDGLNTNVYSQELNASTSVSSKGSTPIHEFTSLDAENKPFDEISPATKSVTFNPIIQVQDNVKSDIESSNQTSDYASRTLESCTGNISPSNPAHHLKSIVKGSFQDGMSLNFDKRNMGTNEQARLSQQRVKLLSTNPIANETDIFQNKKSTLDSLSVARSEMLNRNHSKGLQNHAQANHSGVAIQTSGHIPRAMCSRLKERAQRFLQGSGSASSTSTSYETATSCGNKSLCMQQKICLKNKRNKDDTIESQVNTALKSFCTTLKSAAVSVKHADNIPSAMDKISWPKDTSKYVDTIKSKATKLKQTDIALIPADRTLVHVDTVMYMDTHSSNTDSVLKHMDMTQLLPNATLKPTNTLSSNIGSKMNHVDGTSRHIVNTMKPVKATSLHVDTTSRQRGNIASYMDTELKPVDATTMNVDTNVLAMSTTRRHTDTTDIVSRHMDTTVNPIGTTLSNTDTAFKHIDTATRHIGSTTKAVDSTSNHIDAIITPMDTISCSMDTMPKSTSMASMHALSSTVRFITTKPNQIDTSVPYCDTTLKQTEAISKLFQEPTEDDLGKIAAVIATEAIDKARIIGSNDLAGSSVSNTLAMVDGRNTLNETGFVSGNRNINNPRFPTDRVDHISASHQILPTNTSEYIISHYNTSMASTSTYFAGMSDRKVNAFSKPSDNMNPTCSALKLPGHILRSMKSETTGNRHHIQSQHVNVHDSNKMAAEHRSSYIFKPIDNVALISPTKEPSPSNVNLIKPIAIHRSSSENSQYNSPHSPLTTRLVPGNGLPQRDAISAQIRAYSPDNAARNGNKWCVENIINIHRTTSISPDVKNITSDKDNMKVIQSPLLSQSQQKSMVLQYKNFDISSPPITPHAQLQQASHYHSYLNEPDEGTDPEESNQLRHDHTLPMCRGLCEIYPKLFQHKRSPIMSKLGTAPTNSGKSSAQWKQAMKTSIQTSSNSCSQERSSPNQLHSRTKSNLLQASHESECVLSCNPSQNTSRTLYKNDEKQQHLMSDQKCFDHQTGQRCSQGEPTQCINGSTLSPCFNDTHTRNNNTSPALNIMLNQTFPKQAKTSTSAKLNVIARSLLDTSYNTDKVSIIEQNPFAIMSPLDDALKVSMWLKSVLRPGKRKTRTTSISSDILETRQEMTREHGDSEEIGMPNNVMPYGMNNTDLVDSIDKPQAVNLPASELLLSENIHSTQYPWCESKCITKSTEGSKNNIKCNISIENRLKTDSISKAIDTSNERLRTLVSNESEHKHKVMQFTEPNESTINISEVLAFNNNDTIRPGHAMAQMAKSVIPQAPPLPRTKSLDKCISKSTPDFGKCSYLYPIKCERAELNQEYSSRLCLTPPHDHEKLPLSPSLKEDEDLDAKKFKFYSSLFDIQVDNNDVVGVSKFNVQPAHVLLGPPTTHSHPPTPCNSPISSCYPASANKISNLSEPIKCGVSCNGAIPNPESFIVHQSKIPYSQISCHGETRGSHVMYPLIYEFNNIEPRYLHTSSNTLSTVNTGDQLDLTMPHSLVVDFIPEPPTYDDVIMEFAKYNLSESERLLPNTQFPQWPDLCQSEPRETTHTYHLINKPEKSTKDDFDLSETIIPFQRTIMALPLNFSSENTEFSTKLVTNSDSDCSIGMRVRKQQCNLETMSHHAKINTLSPTRTSETSYAPITDPGFSDKSAQTTVSLISMDYECTYPQMDDNNASKTSDHIINVLSAECNARNLANNHKANSPNSSSDESDTSTGTVVLASASVTSSSITPQIYPVYNKKNRYSNANPGERELEDSNSAFQHGYSTANHLAWAKIQVCKDAISMSRISDSKFMETNAKKIFIDLDRSASMSTASESYYTAPSSVSHTPTDTLGYSNEITRREDQTNNMTYTTQCDTETKIKQAEFGINGLSTRFPRQQLPSQLLQPPFPISLQSCLCQKHRHMHHKEFNNSNSAHNIKFSCNHIVKTPECTSGGACDIRLTTPNCSPMLRTSQSSIQIVETILDAIISTIPNISENCYFAHSSLIKDYRFSENETSEIYINREEPSKINFEEYAVVASELDNTNNSAYMCVNTTGLANEPYFVDKLLPVPENKVDTRERQSPLELSVLQCMVYSY